MKDRAAAKTRIYKVTERARMGDDVTHRLVEASSGAQAIRMITEPRFDVALPDGKEIAALMKAGVGVLAAEDV